MNKTDLIEELTVRLGDRRTASAAVEGVVDVITRAVAKGEKVGISGFGVFEKADRAARTARNPTTGEAVKLKKTSVPKFRPGQGFKDIVSGAKKVPPPSKTPGRAVTARAGSAAATAVPAPARAAARTAVKASGRPAVTRPAAAAGGSRSATRAPARAAVQAPGRTVTAKAPAVRAPAAKSAAPAAKSPGKAVKAPARAVKASAGAAKSPTKAAPAKKAARR